METAPEGAVRRFLQKRQEKKMGTPPSSALLGPGTFIQQR